MKIEKIKKIMNMAKDYFAPEKQNASRVLAKQGVYIDIAGIEWTYNQLNRFSSKKRIELFGFDPFNNK